MNELLITVLIGWAFTKFLDKKAETKTETKATESTQLAPGYSQKLGKVIGKWPNVVPENAGDLLKLFSSDENYIGPGAVCQWPKKFQLRDMILQSYIYQNQLIATWNQLSPADRNSRQGDEILDNISAQKQIRKDLYNNLVSACVSGPAPTGAPIVTATATKIVAP